MGKVDVKKQHKRVAILEAALELFTVQGITHTSISEIAARSGVAQGTFYLYFKDKYDIRNKLVIYQSRKLFREAYLSMVEEGIEPLEEQMVFISNHVLDQLNARKSLLELISKNLSWGILRNEMLRTDAEKDDMEFIESFHSMTEPHGIHLPESEIMLYMLSELIGGACYSAILYEEPCDLETLKPYLFESVRQIVRQFLKE